MPILITDEQKHAIDKKNLQNKIKIILVSLNCEEKEISVLLTDDKNMQRLNNKYRNQNKSTDVLSFPQDDSSKIGFEPLLLGDVVISVDSAKKQSTLHELSLEEELVLLLIHGILHLLGYDHERSQKEARQMQEKTRKIFYHIFPEKNSTELYGF